MKKLLSVLLGLLCVVAANAAQIANVEYVHKMIEHKWDISVPYNPNLSDVRKIANMKYLLTAIDVANEILNGEKTTDYGNGEFATTQIADTVATNTAVETLVKKIDKGPEFTLTTTPDTNSFEFSISAAGEFVVDWGDGTVETITKPDTTNTTYSHNYSTADEYTIGLSGQATAYNTSTSTAAISFYVGSNTSAKETNVKKIASIDGSLGAIFGTLSSDTNNQPRFYYTFSGATNMTGSIPANLFTGISGAPASRMFDSTFYKCSGLTGAIPDGLFGNLTGAPASYMFNYTFYKCSGLTGAIPDGLFAGISGAPAEYMFSSTFSGCSGLTGAIPAGLFAGISGAPAYAMFDSTFYGCSGLTSIPENLFGDISGTLYGHELFAMFAGCTSLTGPSARINGQYLYEIWPDALFLNATGSYDIGPYYHCTGLSDYNQIPHQWKGYVDYIGGL
ncbi:MAG: hypothetical protein IJN91_01915 [Alphaproteobacteria bacterium]|nr:hypothetical protein [Alphaproteobacteria bacterium]